MPRTVEELEGLLEQLSALSRTSQAVTASLELDLVLAEIVSLAGEVVASDYASVVLVDEEGNWGESAENLPGVPAISHRLRKNGLTAWIIRSRRAAIVEIDDDGVMHPPLGERVSRKANPLIVKAGVRSVAGLPLMAKDHLLGVLFLHSLGPGAYEGQLSLLTAFANQAAIAIDNARLYQRAQQELAERQRAEAQAHRRTEQMVMVHAVSQAITSNLERSQVLQTILDGIRELLEIEACSLLRYDSAHGELVFEAVSGVGVDCVLGMRLEKGQGIAGWVAQTGQPALASDANQDARFFPGIDDQTGLSTHSIIAAPIRVKDQIVAVIEAVSIGERRFDGQDLDLLCTLSDTAAVAIDNARLYEELKTHSDRMGELVAARTEELRVAKDRAEAILRSAGDPILLTDVSGRLLAANPAFEQETGYSSSEIGALRVRQLLAFESSAESEDKYEEIQTATLTGQRWRGELEVQREDGTTFEADVIVSAIFDQAGQVMGLVSSIRDISRLKEVDRLKDRFVSDISHQLRTPLTSFKLFLHLLERAQSEDRQRYLDALIREQNRLQHLIEQLLDLSRFDLGTVPIDKVPLDAGRVVRALAMDRQALARAQGLELVVQLSDDALLILADERTLVQMLDILIVNAFQYTPAPGQVTVSADQRQADGEEWVVIAVRDTGLGIAQDELHHIFDRFYRGQAAQQSSTQGTGLGLAICREIIERHQGHIEVESEPDRGSTFTVYIPVLSDLDFSREDGIADSMTFREAMILKDPMPHLETREGAGPRVLLVEDEVSLLLGLQETLTAAGYQVWTARNGLEGLERLEEMRPDLIVSDVMMPKMNGFEFCRAVRARPDGVAIPFIFLTARGQREARLQGLELGAEDYVVKPFDLEELLQLVDVRLRRSAELEAIRESEMAELKSRITTMLGHEFRTPLTYISAYSSMLTQGGVDMDDAQFRSVLAGIQSGSERLSRLVMDFLLLVDLETGAASSNYELSRETLAHPGTLITQVVDRYRPQAEENGVTLELQLENDLPSVLAAATYLSDALGRILDNAIKFSPPTGERIIVRAESTNSELRIVVQDEGIGIPPDELAHIYTPFHQVDRQRREQRGSGLGLAIAQGLVELHGGRIETESELDVGSTFVICLPALSD